MARGTAVSVVIPTYCEHESIGNVLEDVHDQLSAHTHEVLVVDDSPDRRTRQTVRDSYSECEGLVWVPGPDSGLSAAVVRGFQEVDGERVVVMDGDGQHPAEVLPQLVAALDDADVAVGSRHVGGEILADWSMVRYAMSFGASCLAWAAVPDSRPLQDPMSGLFAVRRDVVSPVLDELDPVGYKVLLEVLARAPVSSVAEVPVTFRERDAGESGTDAHEMVRYLRHLARLAVESRRRQLPERTVVRGDVA